MTLWLHPLFQLGAGVLALYVLHLGIARFRSTQLKHRTVFPWRRHVRLGVVALCAMLGGFVGGLVMVNFLPFGGMDTGFHALIGWTMVPLIAHGLVTGWHLNRRKPKARLIPLVHGVGNAVLTILFLVQVVTGWPLVRFYLLR